MRATDKKLKNGYIRRDPEPLPLLPLLRPRPPRFVFGGFVNSTSVGRWIGVAVFVLDFDPFTCSVGVPANELLATDGTEDRAVDPGRDGSPVSNSSPMIIRA